MLLARIRRELKPINAYFLQTIRYSTFRFIVEMTALSLGFDWLIRHLGSEFFWDFFHASSLPPTNEYKGLSVWMMVLFFILQGPMIETLLYQWFPIRLCKWITRRKTVWIWFSALLFGLVHILPDAPNEDKISFSFGVIRYLSTFTTGFFLAWSFVLYQRRSFLAAWGVTAAIHALGNIWFVLSYLFYWDGWSKIP